LPDQWKASKIVPVHKKGDKIECSNYSGISLISTSYKILSNIFLSSLSPYIDEITGDHQCGFQHNKSTADQVFCIHQILEKKWEYHETVCQLFADLKKTCGSC
jgi:sorting nexin-29